jgi:hypothetical protein
MNPPVLGFVLGVALLFSLLGCASGGRWQTEAAAAPGADVAAYETFGWRAAGADGSSEAPLSVGDANLRQAIRTQLVARGYREVEADPALHIAFETETQLKEKSSSSPFRVGVGVGSWGGPVGGGVEASAPVGKERVKTVQQTRITLRAVDVKGNREVWSGSTTGEIAEGADPSVLEEAVAALLDDFPARR